jgi:hypothetical protein
MDSIARQYVQLVLALGKHDPNYVDAYYGPPEWREEATKPLDEIVAEAKVARQALPIPGPDDSMDGLRWRNLGQQLDSLAARAELIQGVERPFDEESMALYNVVAPHHPDAFYAEALAELEARLPGDGPLTDRFAQFRQAFFIPKDKVDAVFRAAIEAARERTKRFIELDEAEDFRIEYVTGEVWSAYNWYQGNARSLIQLNLDFPVSIDRALHLACHEGYPGHHVYNALLERHLVREQNWLEFTVYPLYSPQSLIAEGTAEYGVELSFPAEDRLAFEQEVLYPLAGLDPSRASELSLVLALVDRLGWAANDAARRYLDGEVSREDTIAWLVRYALSTPERAEQRVRFIEAHRSYVVTYNVGQELVKRFVESHAETTADRWSVFRTLLSTPQVPSNLT